VLYRGQKEARIEFLPLKAENWITCGNALRLDWLSICPPSGTSVKHHADDLFHTPLDQAQIDFENTGGETYICGNPPYLGSRNQTDVHRAELEPVLGGRISNWRSLDYVAGWLVKAADYARSNPCTIAFVTTNSVNQGISVSLLWPEILRNGLQIIFAHRSFRWSNLASQNAGVTVAVVGLSNAAAGRQKIIFEGQEARVSANINAYLVNAPDIYVEPRRGVIALLPRMEFGNMPRDGGHFLMDWTERQRLLDAVPKVAEFVAQYLGSEELINGQQRFCL